MKDEIQIFRNEEFGEVRSVWQAMMTCKGKEHFRKMWSGKGGEEK